jgi:hypothetical protein
MATDTSLEDGTNILKHVRMEHEHVRELSQQKLHLTETNSNEFKDTHMPSDRFCELLESNENISTDKQNVRAAVTSEL